MSDATFQGGVHPFDGKDLSKDKPVKTVLPKGDLVYPLSQHIGAPARPVVAKGDKVLVGQRIAEASGFVSANIVSSVSGTVKSIEPRLLPNGGVVNSIIVENDHTYETIPGMGTKRDSGKMSKEEIRQAIQDAGVVGMGGAGFPTHVKLTPKDDSAIDYVIVNGAECEPYLTSDYRMMLEEPEKIVEGLRAMLMLFENAKGVIGIEKNKPEAIARLTELVKDEPRMEVCPMKVKYPQGAERNLIYAVTGRKLTSKKLPADVGCVVSNVDSVIAIYMAVCESTPLMRRIVTVTGDAIKEPQNFRVRTGTCYGELIEEAGGFVKEPQKVISGGPMMGFALTSLEVPVTKTSSALLCLGVDAVEEEPETACIRCGRCGEVCPSHLVPQKLMEACERFDLEQFEKLYGMECYECGSCTYTCPAKRPLTQAFKQARKAVADNRRKQQAAK